MKHLAARALARSVGVLALLPAILSAQATAATPAKIRVAYKAARLLDPSTGDTIANAVILVDHDTIVQVGSGLIVPRDVPVTDLGNVTLLPGLIDVHSHLASSVTTYWTPRGLR